MMKKTRRGIYEVTVEGKNLAAGGGTAGLGDTVGVNALIPELGHDQAERMQISTAISLTFIVGTALAYVAPVIWGLMEPSFGRVTAISSLVKTFRNREFRIFVGSDIFYWIGLTMFQTGLPFFVTSLLGLSESMSTIYFVAMTALSLVFYVPVNILTKKMGKRNLVLTAFLIFAACFGYTAFMGPGLGISPVVGGIILVFYNEKKINSVIGGTK